MTRRDASLATKQALAASLKKYMAQKALGKITVKELIADCGVNRNTFYYHFEDIYDLLKWTLEQEAIEVVKHFDLPMELRDAVSFVMDYVECNRHILACACDSMGRDELRRFFRNDFMEILLSVISGTEKNLGVQLEPGFRLFLCEFYTEAVSGTLLNWVRGESAWTKEETLAYLERITHTVT